LPTQSPISPRRPSTTPSSLFAQSLALVLAAAFAPLAAHADSEFGADVRLAYTEWPQNYGETTNDRLTKLEIAPGASYKPTEKTRFVFKPYLLFDPGNTSPEERTFVDLGETTLRYKGDAFTIEAGSQIFHWGVTDGYNPLDVVNPEQYFDPLHAKKMGVVNLHYSHSSEQSEQELILIPTNRAAILPGPQSRWLPRKIFIPQDPNGNEELILPDTLRYTYESRETLNDAFKDNIAARLQWHWSGIDIGVIGYEGVAGFPLVQPVITGTIEQISPKIIIRTDPDVQLRLKDYRQKLIGGSWVSSQAGFLLKYATSYATSVGEDPLLPGWEHHNIIAVEKNFQPTEALTITAVLQHAFVNTERKNESNLSVNEIFRRAWMAGARIAYGDLWTVTAFALYDSIHFSNSQDITIARKFNDAWTIEVNGIAISGAPDTPLGVYDRNDSITLSLARSL
jgi:hypothetical protein